MYITAEILLNSRQKNQLIDSITRKIPMKLKLSKAQIMTAPDGKGELILLTPRQINSIVKAFDQKKGLTLNMSLAQLMAHRKMGLLKRMITGEGVFDDIWDVAKKVGGVVADKVLEPTAHVVAKVAKSVGKKGLKAVAKAGCDALAVGTLAEQPELIPLAVEGCNEISNAIIGDGHCGCGGDEPMKKGRGRPKKS